MNNIGANIFLILMVVSYVVTCVLFYLSIKHWND